MPPLRKKPPSPTARPSTKLHPLEFDVFRQIQAGSAESAWRGGRILVACSGGADSVALVQICRALSQRLEFDWAVAHVHHGVGRGEVDLKPRRAAQRFVQALAKCAGVACFTNSVRAPRKAQGDDRRVISEIPSSNSQSENALRRLRRAHLESWRADHGFSHLAFAHQANDLAETRLMRLIRGTGVQGLPAMQSESGVDLRPLLHLTRDDLRRYLGDRGVKWIEDPSNLDDRYLRNWIRNDWLPRLERQRPGSTANLARSLDRLAQMVAADLTASASPPQELDLVDWRKLKTVDRETAVARVLRELLVAGRVTEFTRRHVQEILKRLDSRRKVHRFDLLGLTWEVIDGRLRIS